MAEKKVTRLQFSQNELTDEKVRRAAAKAERAAGKAEKAQSKLPRRTKIRIIREAAGEKSPGGKLRSEKHSAAAAKGKLRFEKVEVPAGKPGIAARMGRKAIRGIAGGALAATHRAINEADDGNSGTEALNSGKSALEAGGYLVSGARYSHKLKSYEKAERLVKKSDKANADALYAKARQADPDAPSNPLSRWKQKQEIKREYAAAKKAGSTAASGASKAAKSTEKAAKEAKSLTEKTTDFIKKHPKGVLLVLLFGLLAMLISSLFSSCSVLVSGSGQIVLGTSFTAEDEDILGADGDYKAKEKGLQNRINKIKSAHPGYDEYRYHLSEVGHNPYELAALLTVLYEDYTREEVQAELERIFEAQYELTLTEEVEVRTRTETRTGSVTYTDPETGESTTEYYEYEVEVQYEYSILNVTLTNTGISAVAYNYGLTDDQLERYNVLLSTHGNRPDLFDDIYSVSTGEYMNYDIPGEALTDERFRRMITEAEKYLGYPYVWGGSSPSTSFDCSGFVSWVINHCGNGWSVGRRSANGLMDVCDIIPRSEAKPGDLIFFQGTHDTSGASHVAIYVGDGMMIHCGSPISYASMDTKYWKQHFYCFGRIRG